MVNVWVVETLQHVASKLLELVHWQVECLHQLFELYLVDILADYLVVASIANDVNATQECYRAQYGVRAIQQGYLTLVVGLL